MVLGSNGGLPNRSAIAGVTLSCMNLASSGFFSASSNLPSLKFSSGSAITGLGFMSLPWQVLQLKLAYALASYSWKRLVMAGMTLPFMNPALSLVDMLSLQPPAVEPGASAAGAAAGASPAGAAVESAGAAAGGWLPPQANSDVAASRHETFKKYDKRSMQNSSDTMS